MCFQFTLGGCEKLNHCHYWGFGPTSQVCTLPCAFMHLTVLREGPWSSAHVRSSLTGLLPKPKVSLKVKEFLRFHVSLHSQGLSSYDSPSAILREIIFWGINMCVGGRGVCYFLGLQFPILLCSSANPIFQPPGAMIHLPASLPRPFSMTSLVSKMSMKHPRRIVFLPYNSCFPPCAPCFL